MRVGNKEIIQSIKANSNFCIYTHIKPDGDAVGSAFGLAIALQKLGKKVCVKCQDPWPDAFKDLVDAFVPDTVDNEIGIAVDVSSAARLGIYEESSVSLCIDHHKSNLCRFTATYLEEDAISCSSIIFRLLEDLFSCVPKEVRVLLFVGILTDSDGFKSSEVTKKAFADASDMLSNDICPSELIKKYYSNKTVIELECEKVLLENLTFSYSNAIAMTFLPKDMVEKIGIGNTDSLAGISARIKGVEIGITIFQTSEFEHSISIRANGKWDSSLLAKSLGGGGHMSAAGARVNGMEIHSLIDEINKEIESIYLKESI